MKVYTSFVTEPHNLEYLHRVLCEWEIQDQRRPPTPSPLENVGDTAFIADEIKINLRARISGEMPTEFIVAVDGSAIPLAMAAVHTYYLDPANTQKVTEIVALLTRPDARHQGIATALLARATESDKENSPLCLSGLRSSDAFFRYKMKFQEVGARPHSPTFLLEPPLFPSLIERASAKGSAPIAEEILTRIWNATPIARRPA
jgi:GNAT superfamily N-acetyltransferase